MSHLLKKLWIDGQEFVTTAELRAYCRTFKLDYATVVSYFVKRKYFIRIFRGVFYVKSLDEAKLGRAKYSHLELVAKGLELKKVSNWYFGLHTALKLNNMTYETFSVEDVVNDLLFRANPMNIAGYKFKFYRLSSRLLDFGIEKQNGLRYSDPEKTVLDFIYIWRYHGTPSEKIIADISDYAKSVSKEKMKSYAKKYPKTMMEIAGRLIE